MVTYLRVSTSEQALSGLGLDAQRVTVAAYAQRKGLTIVDEYCDEGISAKSLTGRPAALAALEAVRGGEGRRPAGGQDGQVESLGGGRCGFDGAGRSRGLGAALRRP